VDALLASFVAAFLSAWGDKTQLIVAMLAAVSRKPGQVFAGLLLAAAASSAVAAFAGMWIAAQVTIRATTLLTALALLFAAASAMLRSRPRPQEAGRFPLLTAFILCLAAEFGDRTQFLTFAVAARFGSAPLAAAGATAGILAACLPALVLGERLGTVVPLRALRWGAASLFLATGFIVAVTALQLA
jgi:putative Ca2+/H+ antiporter (TMEM165/GDT1 family)